MKFDDYIASMKKAISAEIAEINCNGYSSKIDLSDGRFIKNKGIEYIYIFNLDSEIKLPDDTPIELEVHNEKIRGTIISLADFSLVISIFKYIGDIIPYATVSTKPAFILKNLFDRLNEIKPPKNRNFPKILIDPSYPLDDKYKKIGFKPDTKNDISFNVFQIEAINKICQQPISFIWGPPGTGKTKTLGLAAKKLIEKGETVLILAHSNIAVDVAMENIAQYVKNFAEYSNGKIIRYGNIYLDGLEDTYPLISINNIIKNIQSNMEREIKYLEQRKSEIIRNLKSDTITSADRSKLFDELNSIDKKIACENNTEKEKEILKNAQLIGCTLSMAVSKFDIFNSSFDTVFVDEASMAYIPFCLFSASLSKKRIAFFGDFMQLPPIAQAKTDEAEKWLKNNIFKQLKIEKHVNENILDDRLVMLKKQYRMHPDISDIINKLFYKNQLINDESVIRNTLHITNTEPGKNYPIVLYDLSNFHTLCFNDQESKSRFNLLSAIITSSLAKDLIDTTSFKIGIITPYRSQARLIKALLKDLGYKDNRITIATVHKFQGSESDIIIFDFVDAKPKKDVGKILNDKHSSLQLANVAISRAKGKLIFVGDITYLKETLKPTDIFYKLITEIEKKAKIIKKVEALNTIDSILNKLSDITMFTNLDQYSGQLRNDIKNLKINLYCYIYRKQKNDLCSILKRSIHKDFLIYNSGNNIQNELKDYSNNVIFQLIKYDFQSSYIGIDTSVLWIFYNDFTIRFTLENTINLLYNFLHLVPENEKNIIKNIKNKDEKSPFGYCKNCGVPLKLGYADDIDYEVRIFCSNCDFNRRVTVNDATTFARLKKITCVKCGSLMVGRKGPNKIFLGCPNYPKCQSIRWLDEFAEESEFKDEYLNY